MSKLFVLTLAAAAALGSAASAAAQQPASAQGAAAIEAKRVSLRGEALNHFTNAESAGAFATAQGGAYRFYGGSAGRGLILWRPGAGGRATSAYIVYGPLLSYFLSHGRESGALGFPSEDPVTGPGKGCGDWPATTQSQVFNGSTPAAGVGTLRFTYLCVQPNRQVEVGMIFQ